MKLLPIPPLPNLAAPSPFLWGSDLLWRTPYASTTPLNDLKTQLPAQLPTDPRLWGREDVGVFLRWCEREFDLPKFEMDLFQMNGKALCLLTKTDLAERIPGAGDILHNILHMLVREAQLMHRHLPNSPVTPTSRFMPSSPHNSHPPTPNWTQLAPPDSPFHPAHLQHFIANSNSVTLSPAPSVDSQVGSPPQTGTQSGSESGSSTSSLLQQQQQQQQQMHSQALQQQHHAAFFGNMLLKSEMRQAASAASSSSNQSKSDSEDDASHRSPTSSESLQQQANAAVAVAAAASILAANAQQSERERERERERDREPQTNSSPLTNMKKEPKFLHNLSNIVTTWPQQNGVLSPLPPAHKLYNDDQKSQSAPNTPFGLGNGIKNEFFPNDSGEPNTNGRLLWDFLQQLLNDPAQRYSSYIAWKCRDTGVFKIVDPAGLAQLWGIQKNHLSMNYDKMSRALRYYYRVNILRKVQGERHCYQFLRNPTELKSIKNISLLRQQPPPASLTANGHDQNGKSESSPSSYNLSSFNNHNNNSNSSSNTNNSMIPPQSPSAFQTSFHHLTLTQGQLQAAAVAAAAAVHGNHFKFSPPPPTSPVVKSMPSGSPIASSVDMDDMPTDLSTTSGERKMAFNPDCYPLIRNSNGLTTIQLVKQEQQYQLELRQREQQQQREREQQQQQQQEMQMEDDAADEENEKRSNSSSSNSSNGQNEPEIDVTNVSNSNCDLIRHSEENGGVATDLRKYD